MSREKKQGVKTLFTVDVFSPRLWDELQGLADALRMSMENAIRYFGGSYLEYIVSGCSIYAAPHYMIPNKEDMSFINRRMVGMLRLVLQCKLREERTE